MLISIIIPAFNEERLIGRTLQAIGEAAQAFSGLGWQTEIIVCDNNSTDRTAEIARSAGAKVVFEPVNQIGRARNSGAAAACGNWLLFVDADSRPSRELFLDVADQVRSGSCLAGGSTIRLDEDSRLGNAVAAFWNALSRCFRLLAGSFIFCETSAFRESGGFSAELFAGEELELTQKLKRLARVRRQRLVILHWHPLETSSRKMHLYSRREHFWFLVKSALRYKTMLRNRESCQIWYDGRR